MFRMESSPQQMDAANKGAAWLPSQKGLLSDCPHRHNAVFGLEWKLLTKPVGQMIHVRDDVRPVPCDSYLGVDTRSSCCFTTFHRFLLFLLA